MSKKPSLPAWSAICRGDGSHTTLHCDQGQCQGAQERGRSRPLGGQGRPPFPWLTMCCDRGTQGRGVGRHFIQLDEIETVCCVGTASGGDSGSGLGMGELPRFQRGGTWVSKVWRQGMLSSSGGRVREGLAGGGLAQQGWPHWFPAAAADTFVPWCDRTGPFLKGCPTLPQEGLFSCVLAPSVL